MLQVSEQVLVKGIDRLRIQHAEEQEKRNSKGETPANISGTGNNAANEFQQSIISSFDNPIHHKEKAVIQFILKSGSKMLQVPENKENNTPAFTETVLSHLYYSFEEDGIEISHPLYKRIFKEAAEHINDPSFNPEKHFMAHPDHEISTLTAELCGERYLLSKFFTEQGSDERNELAVLFEQTTRLSIAYKLSIVDEMLKGTMGKLKDPEVASNPEALQGAMEDFKFLKETQQALNDVLRHYGFGNVALNN
jgi:DNA primase